MKTLVRNNDNISLYLFSDDEIVIINDQNVIVGDPVKFIIGDCNSSNATLFENVTDPGNYLGWKYLYTEVNSWELNPNWNPPE